MNYVNVGHHVEIGNQNEIGARSLIAGYVTIGDSNKIKLNCTIRNRKSIGSDNIIGMCSNVVSDLGSKSLYFGNPCKKVKDL
jgi:UDP-3-O-[3-hydroxymyristoyl] glucosamine N-acyltransferase